MKKRTKTPKRSPNGVDWEIGGLPCPQGKSTEVEVPVSRLPTGTWLSIPLRAVRGAQQGPTIWLSAAIHGDEVNGVAIIHDVLDRLDPAQMRGAVIAVPIVNVFGLVNGSRYLPDGRDLNRSFPGSARGSLAGQIAHLFMNEVVGRCQLGIDLHTGSGGRGNLPQVRGDLDDAVTRAAARRFGAPIAVHSSVRDGSLRYAARARGVAVMVYEAGEAGRFDTESVRIGTRGVLNVMASMGMIDGHQPSSDTPLISRKSSWVRARRGGFCNIVVSPGDRVTKSDTLAIIFDTLTREPTRVKAEKEGLVIGLLRTALVNRGDAIVHVAEISTPEP